MSIGDITTLLRGGVMQVIILAAPILLSALVVGLVIAIIQATTSIQEQTLTFVPKLLIIMLILALAGGWMFATLGDYTRALFARIPEMLR
ncbi:MAG: flagellar biosynthesis protein FliQ [Treponema sp.]|jgi:flagellar biosynthetic protein FliQ|nr:flagellar biosynthesis protein FliQ [Treponema sp.]